MRATRPTPSVPVVRPATGRTIPVVCVDAYDLARLGVVGLGRRYPELRVVAEAAEPQAALAAVAERRPAVVTVGDALPGRGLDLVREIRARYPEIGVVVVSHLTDDAGFEPIRQAGASAFVSRSSPVTAVVAAVRQAALAPADFHLFGVPWSVARTVPPAETLSRREVQVLGLMQDGHSLAAIAAELAVRPGTVRTYVARLYAKLRVSNRSQALVVAAAAGLLPTVGVGGATAG